MKKFLFLTMAFLIAFGAINVSAQFNIKIPKIGKPKKEEPKTEQPKTDGDSTGTTDPNPNPNQQKKSLESVNFTPLPQPTNVPVLLKNTLRIEVTSQNSYWKAPGKTFYTSWVPKVWFSTFYDDSEKVRYTAEWLNPDGSLWFSEALEGTQSESISNYAFLKTKAIDTAGTFGLRLLNSKTKEVVFQGKFKVTRMQLNEGEPRYKNLALFNVDDDWHLPIGYVGFEPHDTYDWDPMPAVYMWFKGELKADDFEARLFFDNQLVTSTDDGGSINNGSGLGAEDLNAGTCGINSELCHYLLWHFQWKNFRLENYDKAAYQYSKFYTRSNPDATYGKDKPGEYTVKVFYKGAQVRETKFTIAANGWLAPNAYAAQMPLDAWRIVVPVKVLGTLDKWNPTAWKTDAFYGNPLKGFVAP